MWQKEGACLLRRDAAEQRRKELLRLGWSANDLAWGAEVEP